MNESNVEIPTRFADLHNQPETDAEYDEIFFRMAKLNLSASSNAIDSVTGKPVLNPMGNSGEAILRVRAPVECMPCFAAGIVQIRTHDDTRPSALAICISPDYQWSVFALDLTRDFAEIPPNDFKDTPEQPEGYGKWMSCRSYSGLPVEWIASDNVLVVTFIAVPPRIRNMSPSEHKTADTPFLFMHEAEILPPDAQLCVVCFDLSWNDGEFVCTPRIILERPPGSHVACLTSGAFVLVSQTEKKDINVQVSSPGESAMRCLDLVVVEEDAGFVLDVINERGISFVGAMHQESFIVISKARDLPLTTESELMQKLQARRPVSLRFVIDHTRNQCVLVDTPIFESACAEGETSSVEDHFLPTSGVHETAVGIVQWSSNTLRFRAPDREVDGEHVETTTYVYADGIRTRTARIITLGDQSPCVLAVTESGMVHRYETKSFDHVAVFRELRLTENDDIQRSICDYALDYIKRICARYTNVPINTQRSHRCFVDWQHKTQTEGERMFVMYEHGVILLHTFH